VVKVAAVQFRSLASAAHTRQKLEDTLSAAALAPCDLIVLPEAAQCQMTEGAASIAAEPEPLDGPFVSLLQRHATRLEATLVAGMFEEAGGPLPFNTTVVVDSSGLRGAYRKTHLYDALGAQESKDVQAGPLSSENTVTFALQGLVIGVQTCFDLRFPEVSRRLVDAGADVLVLGAAWYDGPGKIDQWRVLCAARAIESTAYVVAAAQPSPRFCGTTAIIDPRGSLLGEASRQGDEIVSAALDPQLVRSVRAEMPLLALRRLGFTAER
jgi:predicted amidohydrolase